MSQKQQKHRSPKQAKNAATRRPASVDSPNATLGDLIGDQLKQAFAAASSGAPAPKRKPAKRTGQSAAKPASPAGPVAAPPKPAPEPRFHTLVFHTNPDLESTMIAWLILSYAVLAERLGVVAEPDVKFISAGPFLAEEWADVPATELTAENLSAQGYMLLDVGGGDFDHHRRYPDKMSNEQSSLDMVMSLSGADVVLGHMKAVVQAVSDNDLRGQQIVRDTTYRSSSTPHTPRHLRNVIRGWNRIHPDSPQSVLDLACLAYSGIATVAGSPNHDTPETVCQLFLADDLVQTVKVFCTETMLAGELTAEEAAATEEAFSASVEAALQSLEADWQAAEADYWSPATQVHRLQRQVRFRDRQTGKLQTRHKPFTLVVGTSDSERFAEVARRGNCGETLPCPDQPRRHKADVCIHFRPDGRFVAVSRHMDLAQVAAAVRRWDLARKGVDLKQVDRDSLRQVGHLEFPTRSGGSAQALLLAFPKCFGNAFRARPDGIACELKPHEIVEKVISVITGAGSRRSS